MSYQLPRFGSVIWAGGYGHVPCIFLLGQTPRVQNLSPIGSVGGRPKVEATQHISDMGGAALSFEPS